MCSLSADPTITDLFPNEHPKFLTQSGPPTPLFIWASQTFDGKLWRNVQQWRTYRKPRSLLRMVRFDDSYLLEAPPPKKRRVPNVPLVICRISNGHYLCNGSCVGFSGSADRIALFLVRSNPRCRPWHRPMWHDRGYRHEPGDVAFCQTTLALV